MKLNLVEFLLRAVVPTAQHLPPGSMVLCAADGDEEDGSVRSIPIVVLKGKPEARLCPGEPGILVALVEMPRCPVMLFGLHLDGQNRGFPADFSVTMPMHIAEQRSLLRILAKADECMYVAVSGARPTLAFSVAIRPSLREMFATVWNAVSCLPLNPDTDVARANDLATACLEHIVASRAMHGFFSSSGPSTPTGNGKPAA